MEALDTVVTAVTFTGFGLTILAPLLVRIYFKILIYKECKFQ